MRSPVVRGNIGLLAVHSLLDQKAHFLRALQCMCCHTGWNGAVLLCLQSSFRHRAFWKACQWPVHPALNVEGWDSAFSCYLPPASCPFSHFLISQIWPGGDLGFLSAFKAEPSLLFLFSCLINGDRGEGEEISFRPSLQWPYSPSFFHSLVPGATVCFFTEQTWWQAVVC